MNTKSLFRPNPVDRLVGWIDPVRAVKRLRARAALSYIDQTTGYVTGGSPRRSVRGWNPFARSADEDALQALPDSRASSRDLFMNTAVASAALRRIRTNVVGSGLTLQAQLDRETLGLSDEQAEAVERVIEREWRMWAGSSNCDITRTDNFEWLQGLAMLSVLMNGDAFVALPYLGVQGNWPYSLRVQLIEGDYISNPNNLPDTGLSLGGSLNAGREGIVGGIEQDQYGAPIAYWVHKAPFGLTFTNAGTWTRVPAYGGESGRKNILHLMERERIGQRRGMPLLANVIGQLKQLTRLSEAELMAAVITSFFTAFIKSDVQPGGLMDAFTEGESVLDQSSGNDSAGRSASKKDDNLQEMGSGSVVELGEGQSVDIADPKRPNDSFEPFFNAIVKEIGASIEVPYEVLMASYQSSYSASRASMLEAWKFFKRRRTWLANKLCQPVYEEFLTEAVMLNRISAPGFFDDPAIRAAWTRAVWVGPGQGQIDPVKETNAAKIRIASRLSTYEDEYTAINGGDWEAAMERLSRQERKLDELDLSAPEPEPGEQEAGVETNPASDDRGG